MKDDSKGLLQERDKHETICPSQRKFNVFWRLCVRWWDHSRGTKLLERNLRATQSCQLQRGKEIKVVVLWQPTEAKGKMDSPHCDRPSCLQNLSTLQKDESDMAAKRLLWAHNEKKGRRRSKRTKTIWFMKFDGAYRRQQTARKHRFDKVKFELRVSCLSSDT